MSNPPLDFLTAVENRFKVRMEILEENCFKINGEKRSVSIQKTLSEKNWYTKSYVHFTDFISNDPPVFGCAALKASSAQMRVLSMFWKGKELDEGLALEQQPVVNPLDRKIPIY